MKYIEAINEQKLFRSNMWHKNAPNSQIWMLEELNFSLNLDTRFLGD